MNNSSKKPHEYKSFNISRYCIENPHITWAMLVFICLSGVYSYIQMPKKKEPATLVRDAAILCAWPGMNAQQVEQHITRKIESTVASSDLLHPSTGFFFPIRSTSLPGLSIIKISLSEEIVDLPKAFNEIRTKVMSIHDLPEGAGPIQFLSDYHTTAALMLTVASPVISSSEIDIREDSFRKGLKSARHDVPNEHQRSTIVLSYPLSASVSRANQLLLDVHQRLKNNGDIEDGRMFIGAGHVALDAKFNINNMQLRNIVSTFINHEMTRNALKPDTIKLFIARDPQEVKQQISALNITRYSYHQINQFTERMRIAFEATPQVSTAYRSGVIERNVFLDLDQDKLAEYGLNPTNIDQIIKAQNAALQAPAFNINGQSIPLILHAKDQSPENFQDMIINRPAQGGALHLRDMTNIIHTYQDNPNVFNFISLQNNSNQWQRYRAITLAINMRDKEQIGEFSAAINQTLSQLKLQLPHDLIIVKTANQPRQVRENITLFMRALGEAIILVLLVSFIGFCEWRSAAMLTVFIPMTLLFTFGLMHIMGISMQRVSIATLIVALGLLVDDPVVAGDAVRRELKSGLKLKDAAWIGPTKLARAIQFATITNIAAYLPFLLLPGNAGSYLVSLPIVMTLSLIASRIMSMTLTPFLSTYLFRNFNISNQATGKNKLSLYSQNIYRKAVPFCIRNRWMMLCLSLPFLILGGYMAKTSQQEYFPTDVLYIANIDIWLANNATLAQTNRVTKQVEDTIRVSAEQFQNEKYGKVGPSTSVLNTLTSFIGGGGPRYWISIGPQIRQQSYAQIVLEVHNKEDMPQFAPFLQRSLSKAHPEAVIDVSQLSLAAGMYPIEYHIVQTNQLSPTTTKSNLRQMMSYAHELKQIIRSIPGAVRVTDSWGLPSLIAHIDIETQKAFYSGITNEDVAVSAVRAFSGVQITKLRDADHQVPVILRASAFERAIFEDLHNLFIFSGDSPSKVPLTHIADINLSLEYQRRTRLAQLPAISVQGYAAVGYGQYQIYQQLAPRIEAFAKRLPPQYKIMTGGVPSQQIDGFKNLAYVLCISATGIFIALLFLFKNILKPLILFAVVPYGMVGSLIGLRLMNTPFGFMGFMGMISMIGVLVSHILVLLEYLSTLEGSGLSLTEALVEAGLTRMRPIIITVAATITALIPLSIEGGPFWQGLCFAQMGGLAVATVITLFLVPIIYAIFVFDFKIMKWQKHPHDGLNNDHAT